MAIARTLPQHNVGVHRLAQESRSRATQKPRESCESFRVDPDLEPSCHLPATSLRGAVVQRAMDMNNHSGLVLRP